MPHVDEEAIFSTIEGGVDLSDEWHIKQSELGRDPANFRVAIGGRRSGKTTFIGGEALEVADQFPGLTVPYVCNTVGRARDIMMPQMRKFERDNKIDLKYNLTEHKVFTPNGGCVQLFGLGTTAEVEKGRGGSYPALYIDEAGAINQLLLKRAVTETFGPATKDFLGLGGRGILVGGTPSYRPGTYWERLCGGNSHKSEFGASVHHMTIFDNPFFAGREEMIIEAFCKENSLQRNASIVKREWDGLFCIDSDGLAYPGWNSIVLPSSMIPLTGFTSLGVDFGSDHPCAWVVVRFTPTEQVIGETVRYIHHAHVMETYEETGLTVHDVAAITRVFQQNYGVSVTYGDSGGGGAMTIDTLNEVMGAPMEPVIKAGHKEDRIWMTDSMLRTHTLHVHENCGSLTEQLGSVPSEVKSNGLRDHMTGYHDHSLDALHYALLAARQHNIEVPLPPKIGTRAWIEQQNETENMIVPATVLQRDMLLRRLERRTRR